MSLRAALLAVHANPGLDPDDLPDSLETIAILDGLKQAIQDDLVLIAPGGYELSEVARLMVEQPVRLVG